MLTKAAPTAPLARFMEAWNPLMTLRRRLQQRGLPGPLPAGASAADRGSSVQAPRRNGTAPRTQ